MSRVSEKICDDRFRIAARDLDRDLFSQIRVREHHGRDNPWASDTRLELCRERPILIPSSGRDGRTEPSAALSFDLVSKKS